MNQPSPRLRTQRLELSPYGEGDFSDVVRIMGNPQVVWWRTVPLTEAEIRAFFDRTLTEQHQGLGWWLMREPGGPLLGHAALKTLSSRPEWIEVGYHLLPNARGHGYATEAARALLDYGFNTLKLTEIYAVVSPHNAPSQAVMQRLGMPGVGKHQHVGIEVDLFRMQRDNWDANEMRGRSS